MEQLTDIFRFITIGYLLLLLAQLGLSKTPRKQVFPALGFCIGILCYLLADWEPLQRTQFFFVLLAPTFVAPIFFWLFSKSLFDDGYEFKKWLWAVMIGMVVLSYFTFIESWKGAIGLPKSIGEMLGIGVRAIALLFVVLAIVEASRHREDDLILSRLRFRNVFILLAAVLMVLTILAEITFRQGDTPIVMNFLQKAVIAGLAFYFAFRRLDLKPGFFAEAVVEEAPVPKPDVDQKLVNQLLELIEGEKFYRTEGLTIRRLAEEMNVKEYKLRQTINQQLGFRNFNDFLSSYRIAEACDMLAKPENREMTVLEIAFQLGYNSLAPFNKAFKQSTGKTPTEYRKNNVK